MSWRDHILDDFPPGGYGLTLAADPDGLLTEEGVAAELERRGYEMFEYGDDPIAFRYAYERDYRSRWESGEESCLIVLFRGTSRELDALPYDLIRSGRKLSFGLGELLPNLDYAMVSELDREYLEKLYAAYQMHTPHRLLGKSATSDYVLLHVFGIVPETVSSGEGLIGLLLRRHYEGWRVPKTISTRLIDRLRSGGRFEDWPLREILPRREAFLAFLQERWPIFLRRTAEKEGLAVKESTAAYQTRYPGPRELPFDGAEMRVYVDTMFLEGMLKPVSSPVAESEMARLTDGWLLFGLETSPERDKVRRLEGLLDNLRKFVPAPLATHNEWLAFAQRWAEVAALRNAKEYYEWSTRTDEASTELRDSVDEAFSIWVEERYGGLHNLSSTAMVHHIPRLMARTIESKKGGKVALVVLDGLSLAQWVPVRDVLMQQVPALRFEESAVFAWAPTITPVSRQAIFAANPPTYFPASINTTSKEKALWRRFWVDSVGLDPREVSYANFLGDGSAKEIEEEIFHKKVAGIVVQKVDRIMHGMELGERGMNGQVTQWAEEGYLAGLISRLVERGFEVYLTSDHGNLGARGTGNPSEGAIADIRGERVRVYDDPEQRSRIASEFPDSIEWSGSGLPKNYLPLLAPGRTAFVANKKRIVAHGGISLEELAVPFVHVERRASGGAI